MFRKLVWWVCTSVHCMYVYSPLFTSGAEETTDNGENILYQKVYGELVILMSLVRTLV